MATQFIRGGRIASARRSMNMLSQDVQSFAELTREFISSASQLGTAILDQTTQAFGLPGTSGNLIESLRRTGACHVPRRECSDPHLGEVIQTARVGETIRVPLRVRNRTKKPRVYHFSASQPLQNVKGEAGGPLVVQPSQLALPAMRMGLIEARVVVDNKFQPGSDYKTDIVITSERCEPQIICFTLRVLSDDTGVLIDLCCPCSPPVHRVQWYHHFYCDEPPKQDPASGAPSVDVSGDDQNI